MPKYRIETNQGTFEIEADREPTPQDVESHLNAQADQKPANNFAQSTKDEPWKPYFNSKAEYDAAVARQATDNPESIGSKAKMAGQAVGSAALKVGLPAAAVAAAPVTGGASLAALGGAAGMAGQYFGDKVAGEDSSMGDLAAAGIMGAIPGANLAKAGVGSVVKEGVKQGLGSLAATAVQTGLNQGRGLTGTEAIMSFAGGSAAAPASRFLGGAGRELNDRQANMAMRDEVHRAWRAAGGKIDPAAVDSAVPGLQTLAGKEGMKQTVSVENAPVITKLVREELGIPGNKPISVDTLEEVRKEAGKSYAEVANISKQAASDLENLKQARFNAKELGDAWKSTGNPAARQPWLQAKQIVQNLENIVEQHAVQAGKPDLVRQLRKDRTRIAQTYDVQTALNPSNGQVDAAVLAAGYDGKNLTGKLKLVADVANTFPGYVMEPSRFGAPAVSRLGTYSGANAVAQGTPAGVLAAGIPLLGKPARKLLLSNVVQNWAAKNPVEKLPDTVRQAVARISALSATRENTPDAAAAVQPKQPSNTYTDEKGQSHAILNVEGLGRGVLIDGNFYPVID